MTIDEKIQFYRKNFDVLDVIFLSGWTADQWGTQWKKFENQLRAVRKDQFASNERIVFVFNTTDYNSLTFENFFKRFVDLLFTTDISNFFAVLLTNDQPDLLKQYFKQYSPDPVAPTVDCYDSLSATDSAVEQDTFCVLPWNHLAVTPYQDIKTCCQGQNTLGRADQHTLETVWDSAAMSEIRHSVLNNSYHPNCTHCYTDEKHGIQSLRQKSNITFKEHAAKVKKERNIENVPFELKYFDLRFTNFCNIRCRTCNHHLSSKWYHDTVKLDPSYSRPMVIKAGKTETDIWDQILPHIDYVERIYFAGGEPLIMEEHYKLLDELYRRQRFDVEIRYNTNFLQTKLKDREVFEYWRQFKSVRVDASLDAMGPRAEYIRKDTDWARIERNRRLMMEICPNTEFNIMPTVSILNVWHLPDFHQEWVKLGLVEPHRMIINTLKSPHYYRIDIATDAYKKAVKEKILAHCEWLAQYPHTEKIQKEYVSTINYMLAEDNTQWLPDFWQQTHGLDNIRNENILSVLPELMELK